jgi:hypothetical protein
MVRFQKWFDVDGLGFQIYLRGWYFGHFSVIFSQFGIFGHFWLFMAIFGHFCTFLAILAIFWLGDKMYRLALNKLKDVNFILQVSIYDSLVILLNFLKNFFHFLDVLMKHLTFIKTTSWATPPPQLSIIENTSPFIKMPPF